MVTVESSALRSTCRSSTRRSCNPLARAVRTKSAREVMMTWLRRLRMSTADVVLQGHTKARNGKPFEPQREHENEQNAEPEIRGGQDEQEDEPDHLVDPAAFVDRGKQPENQRDDC